MKKYLRQIKKILLTSKRVLKTYGFKAFLYRGLKYINNHLIYRLFHEGKKKPLSVEELVSSRFKTLQPIKYVKVERDTPRINIVTDTIQKQSLLGGVATALILGSLYANKHKIPLRIITRESSVNPNDLKDFLRLVRIDEPEQIEYYSDFDRSFGSNNRIETSEQDVYLSTSWWSSSAVKGINQRKFFFYILQEVETFFYPYGDDHLLCSRMMEDSEIKYIINSSYLFNYFKENGNSNIIKNGIFFEPAFPDYIYFPGNDTFKKKEKYNLFFYARPGNPRNLFYSGIKYLDEAFMTGVLNPEDWNICFAGSDIKPFVFSNGLEPTVLGQMSWSEYAEFARTVDLCFSLMYTPHPSYPPLDIAASGGVVLTNKFANKQDLHYSKNIITAELNHKAMIDGFKQAIALAKNSTERKNNFSQNKLNRDWGEALGEVLSFMDKNNE